MSPLPRLHHYDIMTCGVILHIRTICYNMSHNVGALDSAVHCSRQQCLVAEWSGRSVTVRVRSGPGNVCVQM